MSKRNPSTVADWVIEHPQTARLFEELQIDYCCGGDTTLAQACDDRGLDLDDVAGRLADAAEKSNDESNQERSEMSPGELCDQIEASHHAYLRKELPRLSDLVDKVAQVHGENHPELRELQIVFKGLRAELEPHMIKEEQVLFPAIRKMAESGGCPQSPFGTVANPIRVMEHEHDNAGAALKRIRELTAGFQAPDDACSTWRILLDGLRQLEADMHQHVHKENNILFPMAQQLEASNSST